MRKTALTFEEKITVAFMHYVREIDQQDLAMLYGVNMARVNDACRDIGIALGQRPAVNKMLAELKGPKVVDHDTSAA